MTLEQFKNISSMDIDELTYHMNECADKIIYSNFGFIKLSKRELEVQKIIRYKLLKEYYKRIGDNVLPMYKN